MMIPQEEPESFPHKAVPQALPSLRAYVVDDSISSLFC